MIWCCVLNYILAAMTYIMRVQVLRIFLSIDIYGILTSLQAHIKLRNLFHANIRQNMFTVKNMRDKLIRTFIF